MNSKSDQVRTRTQERRSQITVKNAKHPYLTHSSRSSSFNTFLDFSGSNEI